MKSRWLLFPFAPVAVMSLSQTLLSHEPAAPTVSPEDAGIYANPTNLTVLPKSTSAAQLQALMRRYGEELGVQCDHCHVEDPQSHRFDYASDDNQAKQTARLMMTMLTDINTKYLSQVGDPRYAAHITCGNCHQGQTDPPAFEPSDRR